MNLPSDNVVNAALRHVGTSVGTLVGVFAALGAINPDQANEVVTASHQVMDGLYQTYSGLSKIAIVAGPAFAGVMAWMAARSGTVKGLLQTLTKKEAQGQIQIQGQIVAPPEVAKDVPSTKVVPSS